ncbi:MAG: xanthine dehydrogenase family protein molybdopterin-binding subunit, partial [Proteobacteria bacterium]|nr:xanthine dehydrogenase family protein molybdopterin-binding subunit [Pseudomonadota bacterium]
MVKKFGIGQPVTRLEDSRLLTGNGLFTDDIRLAGAAVGTMVRSPYAHAEIKRINTDQARAADGVLAVYTAADIAGEVGEIPCVAPLPGRDGSPPKGPNRPVLAASRVRYAGDAVAFVVAETLAQAQDAAELVEVDYEALDVVTGVERALSDGAPQIFDDAPGNLSLDWEVGDEAAVQTAFDAAAHVTALTLVNNRVIPNPIEPRAAIAEYSEDAGYTLYVCSQGVASFHKALAGILNEPGERLRIVTPDVGGGFGMKAFVFDEYPLVMFAARKLGRPVKWTGERTESFVADSHGRDLVSDIKLALDGEGKILGYRVDTRANLGAYLSMFAPYIPTMAAVQVLGGVYKIPAIYVGVKCALTNTPPVDAYRGAGRPEAAYMLERAMNQAAAELGLTQDEIRRRNFITAADIPYTNATGATFDSGDFPANMESGMALADWSGFAARQKESEARGRLRGIGMAYYIECTLGAPHEEVGLTFTDDGRVELVVGTQSNGQGHHTTFAQIIADRLDVPADIIDLIEGDTARKADGGGTGGSRSLQMVGNATAAACDAVVDKGRQLAAIILETGEEDISFADGLFQAKGTNRSIAVLDLAAEAGALDDLPPELAGGLSVAASYKMQASTFPNGCHIAEVEVDPETGVMAVVAYAVSDDFGVVINPDVVAGQVHGGVAQGIGQAVTENCVFEEESGQLLTGSFMDYGMPRADDIPPIAFKLNGVPCQTNPLGIKGCGEAGTIGACPSVMNALVDAL